MELKGHGIRAGEGEGATRGIGRREERELRVVEERLRRDVRDERALGRSYARALVGVGWWK